MLIISKIQHCKALLRLKAKCLSPGFFYSSKFYHFSDTKLSGFISNKSLMLKHDLITCLKKITCLSFLFLCFLYKMYKYTRFIILSSASFTKTIQRIFSFCTQTEYLTYHTYSILSSGYIQICAACIIYFAFSLNIPYGLVTERQN